MKKREELRRREALLAHNMEKTMNNREKMKVEQFFFEQGGILNKD